MAKYMMSKPIYSNEVQEALRKAFNLNPAYPIRQGDIIVKSRGVAHANELLEEHQLPYCIRNCFKRDYSHPIFNDELIYKCESSEYGIIMSYRVCAPAEEYIAWEDLKEYLN